MDTSTIPVTNGIVEFKASEKVADERAFVTVEAYSSVFSEVGEYKLNETAQRKLASFRSKRVRPSRRCADALLESLKLFKAAPSTLNAMAISA